MASQYSLIQSILREPRVINLSGCPRSTLRLLISQGLWTRPVRISARAVGWPALEVAAINAARIASKSDDEIRALVVELEAARKAAD